VECGHVYQDPRELDTKFRKAIKTRFFPIGDDIAPIVRGWVSYLSAKKLFGSDDPVFPNALVHPDGHGNLAVQDLSKEHWATATPVCRIFGTAFAQVGLPYVKSHSVRDTLTQLAYKMKLDPEELKPEHGARERSDDAAELRPYRPGKTRRDHECSEPHERKNWTDQWTTEIAAKVAGDHIGQNQ